MRFGLRELRARKAIQQGREHLLSFGTRQLSAEAVMNPESERKRLVVGPGGIEPVGILEPIPVTIRAAEERDHGVASRD